MTPAPTGLLEFLDIVQGKRIVWPFLAGPHIDEWQAAVVNKPHQMMTGYAKAIGGLLCTQ